MESKRAEDSVGFVVVSCDRYADLWDAFFHCQRRYWPDLPYPVYLTTNHKDYDAPDVTVVKVGNDQCYADNIRAALEQVEEPWVILWLEDAFLSRRVDTARLARIVERAQAVPVGYLKLSTDLPLSYDYSFDREIGPIPKGIRYRSAVGLSLYHVDTLKKLLVPGASAWDLDVSAKSNELDEPFFALTSRAAWRPVIDYVNGVNKGRWNWFAVPFLKKQGFGHIINGRNRLGPMGGLYIIGFRMHNWAYRLARKYWR